MTMEKNIEPSVKSISATIDVYFFKGAAHIYIEARDFVRVAEVDSEGVYRAVAGINEKGTAIYAEDESDLYQEGDVHEATRGMIAICSVNQDGLPAGFSDWLYG